MSTPSTPNHRRAVEAAVEAVRERLQPADGPTVELARALADQMDASACEPSSRLAASYLSVTKDLRTVIQAAGKRDTIRPSSLTRMREQHMKRMSAS